MDRPKSKVQGPKLKTQTNCTLYRCRHFCPHDNRFSYNKNRLIDVHGQENFDADKAPVFIDFKCSFFYLIPIQPSAGLDDADTGFIRGPTASIRDAPIPEWILNFP
jgi:hypothetical protein